MAGRYRAFISYSHRDAAFARRVHADLEAWRVDNELTGRQTPIGPVPQNLRPIFRDREDLSGGGKLNDAIRDTLSNSKFLLVLCSPDAARSSYVDNEVRLFKSMGRADRIIPLIIAGEPGDADNECFPHALTHKVSRDGLVLEEREELLAADAREQGDGRARALAKVAAGLLGVPFDEIAKRAEKAQKRRTRVLATVAASMFLLAVAAAGFAWLSENRRVEAERNYHAALNAADSLLSEVGEELINIEGIQLDTTKRVIDRASKVLDELAASLPDALELKVSKIVALGVLARALDAKGDSLAAIETYRRAEAFAEDLANTGPGGETGTGILAMIRWRLSTSLAAAGDTDAAITKLEAAMNVLGEEEGLFSQKPELQPEVASATMFLSLLLSNEGRMDEAAVYAGKGTAIAEALLASGPENPSYRAMHLMARLAQATLLRKQGQQQAALAMMTDVESRLVGEIESHPDMPQLRGLLSSAHSELAGLHEELGDKEAAETARRRSAAIVQRLAQSDAENRNMRRQHADGLAAKAEMLADEGQLAQAAALFEQSLATLEAMAAETPDDLNVQSSLELALSRTAGSLNQGQLSSSAEAAARRLLVLREAALEKSPDDADRMQGVSLALYQLARAIEGTGALEEALTVHRRWLAMEKRRAATGVDNRHTLAEAHFTAGLLEWRLGRRMKAIPHYRRHNELQGALALETPEDSGIRNQLAQGLLNLGELRVLTGDGPGAFEAFQQCLRLRQALVDSGLDSPLQLTDLAWAQARLAQFGDAPLQRWQEVERLLTTADDSSPLGDLEEELLTVSRIVLLGAPSETVRQSATTESNRF
jgi:tetratricopeptide (TPR) repeat protein